MKNVVILAGLSISLSACVASTAPPQVMHTPSNFRQIPIQSAPPAEGSLYSQGMENSLYTDMRARNTGDVITILIEENLKGAKNASTSASKTSDMNLGLTGILGLEFNEAMQPNYKGTVDAKKAIGGTTTDSFDGSGKTSRDASLRGTVSARVLQVLPDGNLFVEGTRELKINNETQYLVLSGVVRPKDVTPDNTISSTKLADARIEYTGEGVLSDKQSPGWLGRILGAVAPF